MGEVINVDFDKIVQEEGMEKALDHLEKWLGTLQSQIDIIELLIKGLR